MNITNQHNKSAAFSLIEVTVVILIFSLISMGVMDIVKMALHKYTYQEGAVYCANEAANIITVIKNDLDKCYYDGEPDFESYRSQSMGFIEDVFSFNVVENGKLRGVAYSYDRLHGKLEYHSNGNVLSVGRGLIISNFFICHQLLTMEGKDGVIRSVPFDPEAIAPEPMLPDDLSEIKVIRSWVKVFLTLEVPSKPGRLAIKQEYVFRAFPVKLNKKVRSIWKK
ncbi:MAG: prepilin-type N-terminal cleavage/methylation domain-containing protein [Candidatus Riflebacteria bacterium]|nr:prepilin-type N-terminal cleavage/methylation domain-containing protein [Candidatus Riflebacteria bacterium]